MTPTHTSTISVLLEIFDKTEICTECGDIEKRRLRRSICQPESRANTPVGILRRPGAVGGGFF